MHKALISSAYQFNIPKLYDTSSSSLFRPGVKPVIGSVLWCDLWNVEHSGIYIGNNKIVHLDGSGTVEIVSPKKFMARLNGWNNAISIFVSCKNGKPVGSKKAATLAKKHVGKNRQYHLLVDNCHRFTAGCLLNDFTDGDKFLFFNQLATICATEMDTTEWGAWDFS
ncbi:lecithin retinol acyltransferase family protein [Neisseria sp. CCUG17229]|uniref:lecithin retinol acyltransferase family protein n=1 Tax=Neisseria sp. CCUG17229 TaxID=3392036 RepID=UPI003A0FFBA7